MKMFPKVLEKLEEKLHRRSEVEKLISDPEIIANTPVYTSYIKELGGLSNVTDKYSQLKRFLEQKEEAESILADEDPDEELRELAEAELSEVTEQSDKLYNEIQDLIVTEDEESHKNVIMEIRAGAGGDEAALFAADLFRMYSKYAERQGWKVEIMDSHPTEIGGFKEVTFSVEGNRVYQRLRYEGGGHRVQRVPTTETNGRIHTSAVTVAVLPEAEEIEIEIDPEDLKVETFCASGPGGQKVNKTSSAVRITHEPTGTVASCQDEKSQHRNREKAMRVLRSRLYSVAKTQQHSERSQMRRNQIGSGDRSDRIRTYNFPQSRMTDHQIKLDLYDLENILLGHLDELIEALMEYHKEQTLKEL